MKANSTQWRCLRDNKSNQCSQEPIYAGVIGGDNNLHSNVGPNHFPSASNHQVPTMSVNALQLNAIKATVTVYLFFILCVCLIRYEHYFSSLLIKVLQLKTVTVEKAYLTSFI